MPERSSEFVPLARLLNVVEPVAEREPVAPATPLPLAASDANEALTAALREVRIFRAALADALDAQLAALVRDVAGGILARELELAPADLAAIVRRALERVNGEDVIAVRVHPAEMHALDVAGFAVLPDPDLRRGDVAIDVRSGTIDAGLGARFSEFLAGAIED